MISFGGFEKKFLNSIQTAVQKEFQNVVKVEEKYFDLTIYFDPKRRQYNGNQLLELVDKNVNDLNQKTIGLFNVDLFIPILTYIFGQAKLNGQTGIASSYRLCNERYGLAPSSQLLQQRFAKELIHELGHTYGLIHCNTPVCVMQSSTYVEDIDLKEAAFCPKCITELGLK